MKRYCIDTSFLVALLDANDVHAEAAVTKFQELEKDVEIFIPFIVLAEIVVGDRQGDALEKIREIPSKIEYSQNEDLIFMYRFNLKTRRMLKANDCLVIATCKRLNAELLTFDQNLIRLLETELDSISCFFKY